MKNIPDTGEDATQKTAPKVLLVHLKGGNWEYTCCTA